MEPVVYAKGCLGAAWEDIKTSPGWVGRTLILGLIMCVPILNFVVAGYYLNWAREVPFGGKTPMPASYVSGKNFEMGFYAFVVSLVVGLVFGFVGGILGLIPFLGALINLALMLAALVATALLQMRMIMAQQLGAGFGIKDAWQMAQRNWGQLLLVTIVPNLVCGLVAAVIGSVVVMFVMLLGLGGAAPSLAAVSAGGDVTGGNALMLVGLLLSVGLVGFVIAYVVSCVLMTVAEALTIRGMGHWVARYAPEWTALSYPVPPVAPTYPGYPQQPQGPQNPGMPQ